MYRTTPTVRKPSSIVHIFNFLNLHCQHSNSELDTCIFLRPMINCSRVECHFQVCLQFGTSVCTVCLKLKSTWGHPLYVVRPFLMVRFLIPQKAPPSFLTCLSNQRAAPINFARCPDNVDEITERFSRHTFSYHELTTKLLNSFHQNKP